MCRACAKAPSRGDVTCGLEAIHPEVFTPALWLLLVDIADKIMRQADKLPVNELRSVAARLLAMADAKESPSPIDPTTEEESGGDVDITRPPLQKRPRAALDDPLSRARTFDPPDPPASWAQGAALMPPPPPRLPMALPVGAPPARDAPGVGGLVHRQAHGQAQGRPAALTVD